MPQFCDGYYAVYGGWEALPACRALGYVSTPDFWLGFHYALYGEQADDNQVDL